MGRDRSRVPGRTVDNVIAVMEAGHPHLTTSKTFYVEISRARHGAELVTDDARALRERLESVTGERIAALEAVEPAMDKPTAKEGARDRAAAIGPEGVPPDAYPGRDHARDTPARPEREAEKVRERGFEMEM